MSWRRAAATVTGSVSQPGSGLFWSMVFGILVSAGTVRLSINTKAKIISYFFCRIFIVLEEGV